MAAIIETGDKIHIITRRLFETDLRRHFAGVVVQAGSGTVKVKGFTYVFDEWNDKFNRLPEERLRIFSLIDGNLVINILPQSVNIGDLAYKVTAQGQRVIFDDSGYSLDVSEFGEKR